MTRPNCRADQVADQQSRLLWALVSAHLAPTPVRRCASPLHCVAWLVLNQRLVLDRDAVRTPGVLGIVPEVLADAEPLIVSACENALKLLIDAGWRVREVRGPNIADLELSNSLGLLISRSEAAAFHRSQETDLSKCIPEVREQLLRGLRITGSDYLDAQRQRAILGERILEEFATCDILVSPTTPLVAPAREDYERYLLRLSRNTIIWSLIGAPAVSIPVGLCEDGLPAGIQFAAAPGHEQTLVNAGMKLERELGFYF